MKDRNWTVRQCIRRDLSSVAQLHKAAFKTVQVPALLYRASPSIIERFYAECLEECILLVSEEDCNINGLALGGKKQSLDAARRRFYWKNIYRFLPSMALRPSTLLRRLGDWRNLFVGTRLDRGVQRLEDPWIFLLMAVSPAERGSGLAALLWEAFEAALLANTSRFEFAVAKSNQASISFCLKRNARIIRETDDAFQFEKEISA